MTYDSDGAGVKAALRAIPLLKEAGILTRIVNMRPYKDPDEFIKALGAEEYQKRIDEAQNSFFYEIDVMQKDYDLADPEQKTRFFNEMAKRLLFFSEELERNNYTEALAQKYCISYDSLRKLVNRYGAQGESVKVAEGTDICRGECAATEGGCEKEGKTGGRDEEVTEASSYKAYRGTGIVFTHRGYYRTGGFYGGILPRCGGDGF